MHSVKFLLVAAVAMTAGCSSGGSGGGSGSGGAQASDGRIEVGYLNCTYAGGTNIIVQTSRQFDCTYKPANGGTPELYSATSSKVGVDLSVIETKTMAWTVLAPASFTEHGVLAGTYGGASADVAVGPGVGADVLVGGSRDSIALQPVAVSGGTGIGAALGVQKLTLTYKGLGTGA